MKNLGILLSGRGSNFEAIAKNVAAGHIPDARIAVVISNKPDAGGIEIAKRMGLEAVVIPSKGKTREEHDREVVAALQQHKVDLVCLAGYMRLLSPWFVQQFPAAHSEYSSVAAAGVPRPGSAGAGLRLWRESLRLHRALRGRRTRPRRHHRAESRPSLDTDDEHTLAARILEQEHVAYSEAINIVLHERFEIVGRRLIRNGLSPRGLQPTNCIGSLL